MHGGREGRFHVQGSVRLPAEKIVGAVGAGDAFAAGVLYGLHEDADMETALLYGVCVAAASMEAAGCSEGVRPLAECLQLGPMYGFRE